MPAKRVLVIVDEDPQLPPLVNCLGRWVDIKVRLPEVVNRREIVLNPTYPDGDSAS